MVSKERTKLDINKDLKEKINALDGDIAYLANEILSDIENGRTTNQIKDFIRGEITQIVREEME